MSRTAGKRPAVLLALAWVACAPAPEEVAQTVSHSIRHPDTRLTRVLAPRLEAHPDQSGFRLLGGSLDAFVARAALADAAESSLDVQYYLFHDDLTGRLLAGRLLAAADRGVRVRILVDDMDTGSEEAGIAGLDRHPNIEIRLFNPWRSRHMRVVDWVFDLGRVSRRMHNKSFVADAAAAILGGRNIGDEYMQAGEQQVFMDTDVLVVGEAVRAVSDAFDLFWNSELAIPAEALTKAPDEGALDALRERLEAHRAALRDSPYARALEGSELAEGLRAGTVELVWGEGEVHHDQPEKIQTPLKDPTYHMAPELRALVEGAEREIWIVSAYFVPGEGVEKLLCDARARGVEVNVLTNSLAATDVWAVHGGYAPYREPLLRCGAELHELSVDAFAAERERAVVQDEDTAVRLHAKTLVVDDRWTFIGSFNLDPRSIIHNTEIGITIDSPELTAQVKEMLSVITDPRNSFEVVLGTDGRPSDSPGAGDQLLWIGRDAHGEVIFETEPHASVWRRMGAWMAEVLPVENQL